MNSNDILAIASDEQAFRLYVIEKLENHEHRLISLEKQQTDFQHTMLKRLDNVEYEQRLLRSKLDGLQTSVYWVLGAVTIFLAAIQLWPRKKDSDPVKTVQPILIQIPAAPHDPQQEQKSA
ncbi:MAG: hypothetical protein IJS39_02955 [Synergistaceae bacterium]|nr:hypothetical protein [Synergistaceae bacterium]